MFFQLSLPASEQSAKGTGTLLKPKILTLNRNLIFRETHTRCTQTSGTALILTRNTCTRMQAHTHARTHTLLYQAHASNRTQPSKTSLGPGILLPWDLPSSPSLQCSSAPVNGAHTDPAKHVLLLSHIGAGPEFTLSSTVPAQHMETWDRPQTSALPGTAQKGLELLVSATKPAWHLP